MKKLFTYLFSFLIKEKDEVIDLAVGDYVELLEYEGHLVGTVDEIMEIPRGLNKIPHIIYWIKVKQLNGVRYDCNRENIKQVTEREYEQSESI